MSDILKTEYERYVAQVFPGKLHPIQEQELRRAFFAGALTGVSEIGKAASEPIESVSLGRVSNLWKELEAFSASIEAISQQRN